MQAERAKLTKPATPGEIPTSRRRAAAHDDRRFGLRGLLMMLPPLA